MENITLGDLGATISFLVAIIAGIIYLKTNIKKWVSGAVSDDIKTGDKELKADIKEIKSDVKALNTKIEDTDLNATKNFLVARLSEIERGELWDEIEKERFWEQYEHYINQGGNTYIQERVNKYKEERKI